MEKALLTLTALLLTSAPALAQSSSAVVFKNRNILTPQPDPTLPGYIPGGNGNGSFHIGIYQDNQDGIVGNGTVGAGLMQGGVTVGLFYQDIQLATSALGTTTASAPFFSIPATQDVVIKDASGNPLPPGSTPTLTIRAWRTTSGSYIGAKNEGSVWGEWTFTSPPLSGAGAPPSLPQTLTAWGAVNNYSNAGFELIIPEPSTIALSVLGVGALILARRRK